MSKTALLFPGQGAQYAKMGRDFYDAFPVARKVFEQASEFLAYDMCQVIFSGKDLDQTEVTQPAILTTSIAIYQVLKEKGFDFDLVAGLSLGEYSGLVAAESLSFKDALLLVRTRGRLMQAAVPSGLGGMIAVIGLNELEVDGVIDETGEGVWLANYNCPGQIVLSGTREALARASDLSKAAGAKMVVSLPLSAPFHTPLLASAAVGLSQALDGVQVKAPLRPIVFNVTGRTEDRPMEIKKLLTDQVKSPVRFMQSLETMDKLGIVRYVEVGPGTSLKGFVKRTLGKKSMVSIDRIEHCERIEND